MLVYSRLFFPIQQSKARINAMGNYTQNKTALVYISRKYWVICFHFICNFLFNSVTRKLDKLEFLWNILVLKRASKKTGARRGAPGDDKYMDMSTASEWKTHFLCGQVYFIYVLQALKPFVQYLNLYFLFVSFFSPLVLSHFFRHVTIKDELPQRSPWTRCVPAT